MKRRAIFLDRDGTLNKDVGYPSDFSQIHIFPSSYDAVRKINRAGFLAIVITNQSGIGRGLLTEETLREIHLKMKASFLQQEARIDAFYYCPHFSLSDNCKYRVDCSCRKPRAGMALQAAADFDIDLAHSYMVGDKAEDILFGKNIRATPILVLSQVEKDALPKLQKTGTKPAYIAQNLLEAVEWILKKEKIQIPALD